MFKARLIMLTLTAGPFALFLTRCLLGTHTGGMSDGGNWMQ